MSMIRRSIKFYLAVSRRFWGHLPNFLRNSPLGRAYGRHLHAVVCRYSKRNQNHSTFFMRNRPEMELLRRLVSQKAHGAKVAIAVLACSKGAEVYSILWSIRPSRPDLKITLQAVDISQEIIDFAREGAYSLKSPAGTKAETGLRITEEDRVSRITWRDQGPHQNVSIFQNLDESEMDAMFEMEADQARIKPWLKEGVTWKLGDANDPELITELGTQDIVVANRFLCHMEPAAAERCLRNIAGLVKPGGYLFVSGVDLDVRTKVAKDLGWKPIPDLIREIHEGDPSLAMGWPLGWWGLEPFYEDEHDWNFRYASAFRVSETVRF